MTTDPPAEPTLSVERIDEIAARMRSGIAQGHAKMPISTDDLWPLLEMARRCVLAEANERALDRDFERVEELTTQLHEEGERATRLQDELDKANEATPDRRFQAACAAMTGLLAYAPPDAQAQMDEETCAKDSVQYADALLARLASPPARAEGEES